MSGLGKFLLLLLKGALAKLGATWLMLAAMLERLLLGLDDGLDDLARAAAARLAQSDAAREPLTQWLLALIQALWIYWALIAALAATALLLVLAGHLPLLWRALMARRRAVFVSFQNRREDEARAVADALVGQRLQVLRVPYAAGAGHQHIVTSVNDLLRRCHAVVCLPGRDTSFVEAEVAAATVAHKPVIFLVEESGTLPNTADKRHPTFHFERAAASGYVPVADFLHHVTQDLPATARLYRTAWAHPALAFGVARVLAAAAGAALLLFLVVLVHGHRVTAAAWPEVPAGLADLRLEAILLIAIPLLLGALLLLPASLWLLLVARALWVQLRAARRAALRVQAGEFSRADWSGIVPGMRPGEALYEAMWAHTPSAHHERAAAR